ncbi:MAG: esterase-like activity of phytase family protein [Caulobacteraceae bacterium]
MRVRWAALAVLALAACSSASGPPAPVPADGTIRIDARPVLLDPSNPGRRTVDGFHYAGGVQLSSMDTSLLGGLSDLKVTADGALTAETDEGAQLTAHIRLSPTGRLVGLDHAKIRLLRGLDGQPLSGKVESDAEGVAVWPNGDLMVSFEHNHRIWLYPHGDGTPHPVPMPNEAMPENEGMEGLALAPGEGPDAYWVGIEAGSIWLCHLQGGCARTPGQFPPPPEYRLSGLADTPRHDLVVLNHAWDVVRGSRIVMSVISDPARNAAPKVLGQLRLAPPLTVDNFEGVAVVPRPDGTWRFYLIVDDNFSKLQRQLLVAFDWKPG